MTERTALCHQPLQGHIDLFGWLDAQHPDHKAQAGIVAEALATVLECTEIQPEDLRELVLSLADWLETGGEHH